MNQTLTNLQDVPGVIGSFVLTSTGGLAGRAMPNYVPDEVFPDLGRRLSTAFATMDASIGSYDDVLLKFDEQWLFCRRMPRGFLGIISAPTVNFPALRMASNMAATRLDALLANEEAAVPVAAPVAMPSITLPETVIKQVPKPAAATAPAPVSAPAPKPVPAVKRMWRGQPVD